MKRLKVTMLVNLITNKINSQLNFSVMNHTISRVRLSASPLSLSALASTSLNLRFISTFSSLNVPNSFSNTALSDAINANCYKSTYHNYYLKSNSSNSRRQHTYRN